MVDFTGTEPSFGKLRGIGWYTYPGEPTLRGAVAFSSIDVNSAELVCKENETKVCHGEPIDTPFGTLIIEVCECVPKEDQQQGEEGEKISCIVSPQNQKISPLQPGFATVTCFDKDSNKVECGDVKWSIDNPFANLVPSTQSTVQITVRPGAQGNGTITADVGNNVDCSANFEVSPYSCLEIS